MTIRWFLGCDTIFREKNGGKKEKPKILNFLEFIWKNLRKKGGIFS
jgi:hypothetical protein